MNKAGGGRAHQALARGINSLTQIKSDGASLLHYDNREKLTKKRRSFAPSRPSMRTQQNYIVGASSSHYRYYRHTVLTRATELRPVPMRTQ